MKTAILLVDGMKQIMFTPETENEKEALKLITPDDNISTVIYRGSFMTSYGKDKVMGFNIDQCQGGYFRAWEHEESVMFVLTPKKEK